mmetsp:Transcript_34888/g.81579  ORF Transcript_34888/g.81579 Transcript_34888/m.81579 type:complete len:547 (+) Transcript_34888:67-1707(+)
MALPATGRTTQGYPIVGGIPPQPTPIGPIISPTSPGYAPHGGYAGAAHPLPRAPAVVQAQSVTRPARTLSPDFPAPVTRAPAAQPARTLSPDFAGTVTRAPGAQPIQRAAGTSSSTAPQMAPRPSQFSEGCVAQYFAQSKSRPSSPPPGPNQELANRVRNLLHGDAKLFKRYCGESFDLASMGESHIDKDALMLYNAYVAKRIGVPDSVFGDAQEQLIRFDFDGNGTLEKHEAFRLAKYHLIRYWRKDLGGKIDVPVPTKSIAEAGFTIEAKLGSGGQGSVDLVTDRDGTHFCIKSYSKGDANAGGLQELQEEFMKMKYLQSNHVAKTFEIFQDAQFFYVVNEPYFGGDLSKLKKNAREQGVLMTKHWWKGIFKQCFQALAWMHQQAIMHCDIKEQNIMLKTENYSDPQVVVIDLGLSRAATSETEGVGGTPGYIPPETWRTGKWFPRGDNFSMGVTIVQLLTDRYLFTEGCSSIQEVAEATQTRQPPFHLLPLDFDDAAKLLSRLLSKELLARPKAPQVLSDPWFVGRSGKERTILDDLCGCGVR